MPQSQLVFASDIGGVLMTEDTDTGASVFDPKTYLDSAEVEGSFQALAELSEWCCGRTGLISKCGEKIQIRTMEWLEHSRLTQRTGIRMDDVYFCLDLPHPQPRMEHRPVPGVEWLHRGAVDLDRDAEARAVVDDELGAVAGAATFRRVRRLLFSGAATPEKAASQAAAQPGSGGGRQGRRLAP